MKSKGDWAYILEKKEESRKHKVNAESNFI
jgi:hypothetical protein